MHKEIKFRPANAPILAVSSIFLISWQRSARTSHTSARRPQPTPSPCSHAVSTPSSRGTLEAVSTGNERVGQTFGPIVKLVRVLFDDGKHRSRGVGSMHVWVNTIRDASQAGRCCRWCGKASPLYGHHALDAFPRHYP